MSMTQIKNDFLLTLTTEDWDRNDKRTKQSFWPTDGLRHAIEIYYAWVNEPKTNPIGPETLLMFKAASAFEHEVIKNMVKHGDAVDLENEEEVRRLGLNVIQRDGDVPQIRLEMEREFIPITGYLDGITPDGRPIEIKSFYNPGVGKGLGQGRAPSEHYLYQLAMQIDFVGALSGILCSVSRATGDIYFSEIKRDSLDSLLFFTSDASFDEGSNGDIEPVIIDLDAEYKRFRGIMEDHIIPLKKTPPPLNCEYRPAITKELLDQYASPDGKHEKIKKALKGERVLSDHKWRFQYSGWKDLIVNDECKRKGFKSVDELLRYTDEEIQMMMDYGNWEWRTDKNGKAKLFKRKK